LLAAPSPLELLLVEAPLMDPGVPAAGEVKIGAVDEAAGAGIEPADIGGDVVGTTGGARVAPGMVSDHPG